MATPTSLQQQALSRDATFVQRVKFNMENVIGQIFAESAQTVGHSTRTNYARIAQASPDQYAILLAAWLVSRPNLLGANTSVSIDTGTPVVSTDATDAALQSQLMSDWGFLSGAQ